jgi:diguanylate cyclase (GGDEF)-like protein/PAS domain S-box-containing protein
MAAESGSLGVPQTLGHFQQLAAHIADVAYIAGPDRVITWIAPTVQMSLGWAPEELVGTSFIDLLHPDDARAVAASRERLYAGRPMPSSPRGVAMRLRGKTGDYRWFSGRGVPLLDDAGNPAGIAVGLRLVDDLVHERQRAQASEQHVEQILDGMLDPHLMLRAVRDESGALVDMEYSRANATACAVLRLKREDLIGKRVLQWLPGMATDEMWLRAVSALESGKPLVWDDYKFPKSVLDRERYYDIRMVRLEDELSCSFRDVTSRHRAARALAESESRFRLLAENTTDVVITVGDTGTIEWVSPAARAALGRTVSSLLGTPFAELVHPEDLDALNSLGTAEVRLGSPVDRWRWMRMTSRVLPDVTIYTARDIQAEMQARAQLAHEIGHDPLTGLANRSEALAQMGEALRRAPTDSLALLAVGVDDLRSLNEAFTYAAGDRVLTQVGTRLLHFAAQPDDVARVGDSEFTLLVHGVTDAAALADLVTNLQADLSSAVVIDSHSIEVTVSIGIAVAQTPMASELLRDATSAMHHARRRGGNRWEYHDPGLTQTARERLIMRTGIREALQAQQFVPWFQPLVSMAEGDVRGYEALARWDRDGHIVSPAEFIPVAESTDLIVDLDRYILHAGLHQVPVGMDLGVNVSAATLSSVDLAEVVYAELTSSGFDPTRLNLEVTETALLQPTALVKDNMAQVAHLGVRWWVDDFGTGYSSIAHLRDLPIHGLKLDRSFTAGLPDDARCQRLALGLVGLARGLGLSTIAEGIETAEQAAMLAAQGWEVGQGWHYGKPQPL